MGAGDETLHLSLRGIGVPVVLMYLADLGGRHSDGARVEGPEWTAQVRAGPPFRLGAIRLGVTEISFSGSAEVLDEVRSAFAAKVLRGGG